MHAVSRTMEILALLAEAPRGLTFPAIIERLRMEKSAASRILTTLETDGYVTRDPSSNVIRLGLKYIGITLRYLDGINLDEIWAPILRDLAQAAGELVQLAAVESERIVYIAKVESSQRIRVASLLGKEAVRHVTTAGRVWLASLPPELAIQIALKDNELVSPAHRISVEELKADLSEVRRNGYATVHGKLLQGLSAIGVPIHVRSSVVGAVVVVGPSFRMSAERLRDLAPVLKVASTQLSAVWPPALLMAGMERAVSVA